jgi:DNA-binding response OmpR family regulator
MDPDVQEANVVRPMVSRPFASDYPGATIWWVEDDLELCRLVAPQLVACKWELHVFHHPSPMLASLSRGRPDLLILDQVLPKQTGQDVLGGLRQLGHSFPVLILSGMGSPSDRILGLEMGAQDYLVKPFLVKELLLRCEHLLGASKVFAEGPFLHEQSIDLGEVCFSPHQCSLEMAGGASVSLSPGDSRLLLELCRAIGQVVSRGQLAHAIGSKVEVDSSRSIDVRLGRLRRLLEEVSHGSLTIESVRGQGYALHLPCQIDAPARGVGRS